MRDRARHPLIEVGVAAAAFALAIPLSLAASHMLVQLPATFAGNLPCADCEALHYHLDLFADGTYYLRRTYVGTSAADADEIGKWVAVTGTRTLRLQRGESALEQLEIVDAETLRLLDRAGHPVDAKVHLDLKRRAAFAPIEPSLELRGMYSNMADVGMFTECASGKRLTVAHAGDNAALERAYSGARSSPGAPVLATVAGKIVLRPQAEGVGQRATLVVARFVSVSAESCTGASRPDH